MNRKTIAYEVLAVLATLYGVLAIYSLTLANNIPPASTTYFLLFTGWYMLAAILIHYSHPSLSKKRFFIIGIGVVALQLIIYPTFMITTDLSTIGIVTLWIQSYLDYLIVLPIFIAAGYLSQKVKA